MNIDFIRDKKGNIAFAVVPIDLWSVLEKHLDNFADIDANPHPSHEKTEESLVSFFRRSPLAGVDIDLSRDDSPIREVFNL